MSNAPANTVIDSLPELLAHALAMETEAAERYEELADQMETHCKAAVAKIFRRLEKEEKAHLVVTFLSSNAVVILHRVGNGVMPTLINAATGGFNQPSFTVVGDVNGV